MPPEPKVDRQTALNAAFRIVEEKGLGFLNARNIAYHLGCSTKPLFRLYRNMDELKAELFSRFESYYDQYVEQRWDSANLLVSQSIAFVCFASEHRNIFQAMFLSDRLDGRSLSDIACAKWNQPFVKSVMDEHYTKVEAERIFIDMWLYSSGLAIQLSNNRMAISSEEIAFMVQNVYDKLTH